jgi:2'-5' RNA ligase
MKKMLYVYRPLLNAEDVVKWAKSVGFKTTIDPSDMHVTIAYSREPVDWDQFGEQMKYVSVLYNYIIKQFDGGATVLSFNSEILHNRWKQFLEGGASWDYPDYNPHVTLTYKAEDLDITSIPPYKGVLMFGQEVFKELDLDYKDTIVEK